VNVEGHRVCKIVKSYNTIFGSYAYSRVGRCLNQLCLSMDLITKLLEDLRTGEKLRVLKCDIHFTVYGSPEDERRVFLRNLLDSTIS
jgi:hypothetical protein